MDYFVDSNVIIGYYFDCADQWGADARRVFDSEKQIHSGKFVRLECFGPQDNSGKCITITQEIKDDFSSAISLLLSTNSSEELISTAISEEWRIKEIIMEMFSQYKDDIIQFIKEIRNVKRKFEADCNERFGKILDKKTVLFHDRTEKYSHIYKLLGSEIEDKDDINVILDVHHVISKGINVMFISGDYNHIVSKKDFIISNTAIQKIVALGNFSPYL